MLVSSANSTVCLAFCVVFSSEALPKTVVMPCRSRVRAEQDGHDVVMAGIAVDDRGDAHAAMLPLRAAATPTSTHPDRRPAGPRAADAPAVALGLGSSRRFDAGDHEPLLAATDLDVVRQWPAAPALREPRSCTSRLPDRRSGHERCSHPSVGSGLMPGASTTGRPGSRPSTPEPYNAQLGSAASQAGSVSTSPHEGSSSTRPAWTGPSVTSPMTQRRRSRTEE